MLHLFKKTYITLDISVDLDYHRFVVSKEVGYPLGDFLEALHPNKLLGYGRSFEELKEKGQTIEDIIQACLLKNNENYKCIIYCDKESFSKFLSIWFKSIFLNIDCKSSYQIIQAYFSKRTLLSYYSDRSTKGDEPFIHTRKQTFEEFKEIFDSTEENTEVTNLAMQLNSSRTLEYLLGTYIYDGSYKEELKNITKVMINRYVEGVLKETWRTLIENAILKPEFLKVLNIDTVYSLENLDDIKNEERLQPLVKANAWRMVHTKFDRNRKDLNLKEFDWKEILLIKYQIQASLWENVTYKPIPKLVDNLTSRVFLYMDCLLAPEFTDDHLEEILNFERNTFDHCRFWTMKDIENINWYLADYFLQCKHIGETEKLEKFKLR